MFSTVGEFVCPRYTVPVLSNFLSNHNPVLKFVLAFIFYPSIKEHLFFFLSQEVPICILDVTLAAGSCVAALSGFPG